MVNIIIDATFSNQHSQQSSQLSFWYLMVVRASHTCFICYLQNGTRPLIIRTSETICHFKNAILRILV